LRKFIKVFNIENLEMSLVISSILMLTSWIPEFVQYSEDFWGVLEEDG
jgi:hypothetical protein